MSVNLVLVFLVGLILVQHSGFSCSTQPISGNDLRTGEHISVNPKENSKGTVVVFLSTQCPCSRSHEKVVQALAHEFSELKFVGVHSNQDEKAEISQKYFKEGGFSFPIIQDDKFKIADEYRALKTPHAFIVGPQGECWFNGGVDNSSDAARANQHYLRNALLDLRNGKEPKEKQVRTLGCVIKR